MALKAVLGKVVLPGLALGGGTYGVTQAIPSSEEHLGLVIAFQNNGGDWTSITCPYYEVNTGDHANLQFLWVDSNKAELTCIKGSSSWMEKELKMKKKNNGTDLTEVDSSKDGDISKLSCKSSDSDEPKFYGCTLTDKKLQITKDKELVGDKRQDKLVFTVQH
ncbi:hypothetical protein MHLP_00845 [Candidatus Mycoplasma haematolamae str. Purdue]|uniref:Uncharacterized protein n=1 Tax=Mycoplasma haematolamae (strain Purdue) TaxID=1212765 RepID=I7CIP7_MYCHA|nr:hypothetical protein [Candidatus Mycoplasma haematolamae]AFO51749.1 hypothetical protein MHLP_00845 [Candidatus Mycoplasma haematolamae str. Purdue]